MLVFDHVDAEISIFCESMSDHCDGVITTARQWKEDFRQVIREGWYRALSLPELGKNKKSAIGGSSSGNGNGSASSTESTSSNKLRIIRWLINSFDLVSQSCPWWNRTVTIYVDCGICLSPVCSLLNRVLFRFLNCELMFCLLFNFICSAWALWLLL